MYYNVLNYYKYKHNFDRKIYYDDAYNLILYYKINTSMDFYNIHQFFVVFVFLVFFLLAKYPNFPASLLLSFIIEPFYIILFI